MFSTPEDTRRSHTAALRAAALLLVLGFAGRGAAGAQTIAPERALLGRTGETPGTSTFVQVRASAIADRTLRTVDGEVALLNRRPAAAFPQSPAPSPAVPDSRRLDGRRALLGVTDEPVRSATDGARSVRPRLRERRTDLTTSSGEPSSVRSRTRTTPRGCRSGRGA